MNSLTGLNKAQKEAVLHKDGPLLIVAGAGAGKTKTLTSRIIHLIGSGVRPEEILAITFTNKAAAEMRERVLNELKKEKGWLDGAPFMSTFHSLGVHIIKENHGRLGLIKHFSILDESDSIKLVKQAIVESDLDPKQYEPRRIRGIISKQKGNLITLESYREKAASYIEKIASKVWGRYEELQKKENALDFDDLLLKSALLLKNNSDIRNHYQDRWRYIHVDEYQDTNAAQYEICLMLAEKHKNICVVGDSDQNIYSWRGANIQNILNFESDFQNAKVVLLEENYRSTQNILNAANEIIKKNTVRKDKTLFTKNSEGEKICLYEAYDERDEAEFVAEKIEGLLKAGLEPKEVAILYRANFQSRILEETMLQYGIPYRVLGVKFFERKEVKDVLSYIKAAMNRESLSDIKRIINFPARGIGKTTILKIFSQKTAELPAGAQKKISAFYNLLEDIKKFADNHNPSETIKFVIKHSGIEEVLKAGTEEDLERLENIMELVSLSLKYDSLGPLDGLGKLLEDAALASDQDTLMEKGDGVSLMTVHASKGLEFAHVFVTGLEHDLFPHKMSGESKSVEDSEEERRLFYVALTRAKEKLYLSYASLRTIFGSRQINAPSDFIYDIPENLIEKELQNGKFTKTIFI